MNIAIQIVTILAGVWAAMRPMIYGLIFMLAVDPSAIIDFIVVGGCIVLVWHTIRPLPFSLWIAALSTLLISTSVGFFYHFLDYGESGPLPFEWLNGYYELSMPLIIIVLLRLLFRKQSDNYGIKGDNNA